MDERARALEDLYVRRYVGFRNALAALTGDYDTARDAVQEAFARALRDRADLRDETSIAAWVWQIAVRVALDTRRNGREILADTLPEPIVLDADRNPGLAAALISLPPRRRLIVFLRFYADFSYAEIAEACGISEGTVAAALAQAREALTADLSEEAR